MRTLVFILSTLFILSCGSEQSQDDSSVPMAEGESPNQSPSPVYESDSMDLNGLLESKKSNFLQNASEEKIQLYQSGIDSLAVSGIYDGAIKEGMKAPNFTLFNAIGEQVELYSLLEEGPVVLTWYRGGWCPYCNITLASLQEVLPDFEGFNATLVALSPEIPDSTTSTAEKLALEFEVLSDIDNKVATEYGLKFTVQPEIMKAYNQSFSLTDYNGNANNELPIPATYIIDQEGIVQYAFLDADYRKRAEPKELVDVLRSMSLN